MYKFSVFLFSVALTYTTMPVKSVSALQGFSFSQNTSSSYAYIKIAENNEDGAKIFIETLASEGIGFLNNTELSKEDQEEKFRDLLKKNFDMKTIGRFAIGRYWKSMSAQQQKEYIDLFENMIVEVYSRRFNDYNGQSLEIRGARPETQTDSLILSEIVSPGNPNIKVDWRVRRKQGKFQVVDIIIEGVSMSLTQRSDFASVIQRGGGKIDVIFEHLKIAPTVTEK